MPWPTPVPNGPEIWYSSGMKTERKKRSVYYPAFLDLEEKKCIVIGGGRVALRKIKLLRDCGAKVTVISPRFHAGVTRLAKAGAVRVVKRSFKSGDVRDAVLVISATDDEKTNEKVAGEAKRRGILVNVVDDPEHSDFIVPSFLRRRGLTIAVSTSGMSPALARKIRTKLERDFGQEYGMLVSLVEEVRSELKGKKMRASSEVWQKALDLDLLIGLLRSGQKKKAKVTLIESLKCLKRDD